MKKTKKKFVTKKTIFYFLKLKKKYTRVRWLGQNWHGETKLQHKVNLGGLERVVFFKGRKSQLWKTYGAKSVIKPFSKEISIS